MIHHLTTKQMYALDKFTIDEIGIASQVLMENAASSTAYYIKEKINKESSIIILCGSGNNGGDGFAIARHLYSEHFVEIVWIGSEDRMSSETKKNFELVKKLGIPCCKFESLEDIKLLKLHHDVVVDALTGIGAGEDLKGLIVDLLEKVSYYNAFKVAVDCPSGLNCDTGLAHEYAFKADLTSTMYAKKIGLYLNKGPDLCGEIKVANLGVKDDQVFYHSKVSSIELPDIKKLLGKRDRLSSKFDHGRVCIVAGSQDLKGASEMCANAALVVGSGLVHLTTIGPSHDLLPEVMTINCEANENGNLSSDNFERINKIALMSDVIIFGPGLGKDLDTLELVKKLIESNQEKKILLDADALLVLDENSKLDHNFVCTPHIGELARIFNIEREQLDGDRYNKALKFAMELNCILLLKGSPSIIADGTWAYLNLTGNPALAKGGSGDVLSGMIGGMMAQGMVPFEAAASAAHLHGLAADNYVSKYNERTFIASDIIKGLKEIDY